MKPPTRWARIAWHAAWVMDVTHFVVVLPFMLFGYLLIGHLWHSIFIAVVIGLQLAFLHCPMVVLSNWLRSFKDPSYWSRSGINRGLVYTLYRKFGPLAVIPIASGLFISIWMISSAIGS